jgi:hypothetical protein
MLLLPVLYVGSYFAMVVPGPGTLTMTSSGECQDLASYRFCSEYSRKLFWPLEQIDRKIRPVVWGIDLEA